MLQKALLQFFNKQIDCEVLKNSRETGILVCDDLLNLEKSCLVRVVIASVKFPGGEVKMPCESL